ncbi:kinase-like domain-containing protein [Penicillium psychrosexuale]|uniref:kinase-like domain-containing protein n=1 Tax=Penicillium psychrosexuale TaxID=1002107 RepID=UPI00254557D0|nr:kinase-like domain-containing protein [Penicillium psychrosexuale]KAJ5804251.1 kinase-like domain-containing protein [Penicillium psychrosexuale]
MAVLFRLGRLFKRSLFQRPASPVRQFTQSNFQLLDPNDKFEEETLPSYTPESTYSVKIGEVFQSRYQVIGKLGYGGYSTVWLCRDLTQHKYVTLKVFKRDSAEGKREVEAYAHLNACSASSSASHNGAMFVRTALDSFQIDAQGLGASQGLYQCIVHHPLGISLYELRNRFAAEILPEKLVKLTLWHLLLAVDYLHTEAGIVHTDIQEKNVILGIEDPSILADFEEAEKSNPSPRKIVEDRLALGQPITPVKYNHIYRAPEVLLRMSWDQKVDIWNLGVVTWDLFQRGHLFYARDSQKQDSDANHIAEMIALLGPPPRDLLQNSDYATDFFDSEGNWKGAVPIPSRSFEQLEGNLEGEQQELFLAFMRKMVRWRPEERSSAKDLLSDQWLRSP